MISIHCRTTTEAETHAHRMLENNFDPIRILTNCKVQCQGAIYDHMGYA